MPKASLIAYLFCCVFVFGVSWFYYPKWKKNRTEATISWDVSGYYFYLPAAIIYQDLKQLSFKDSILQEYQPTPDLQQAFLHRSGNYVMKYSLGQALQMLPFFLVAHVFASASEKYPADGFSRPYQIGISLWSLLVAFAGLWFLRLVLLKYFPDTTVAVVLLLLVLASNYLDYSAINGAMTHNSLFTLYALLLYLTITYYDRPNRLTALGIGLVVGLAALTRPTELLALLIPVLWGIKTPSLRELRSRGLFFRDHWDQLAIAALGAGLLVFLQPLYWKFAAGEWIVYSYQDQGFSWLSPHVKDGLFSYRAGWLVYSPVFIFAILGFVSLYKIRKQGLFWTPLTFCLLFTYIVTAWDIWWYGGSLGNRAMVQSYPVFALPLAAFISDLNTRKWLPYLLYPVFALCIYYNLWLTHQAHRGGKYMAGQMNRAYFWEVLGTYEKDENDLKLLDTNERPPRGRAQIRLLKSWDFEDIPEESRAACGIEAFEGEGALCLFGQEGPSPVFSVSIAPEAGNWVRAGATFASGWKEWNTWKMPQFIVRFKQGEEVVKEKVIRIFRLLGDHDRKEIFLDVKAPGSKAYDTLEVSFWDAGSDKKLVMDNLRIEVYNAK